jgi:cytochrome c oxidase subunit 3
MKVGPVLLAHPDALAPVLDEERTPRHAEPLLRHHTARLGMWVFLASELLFFGPLFLGYAIARWHAPAGFAAASAHTDVWLGTLNVALLLTSSCLIAIGAETSECGRPRDASRCLALTAALGLAFLTLKGLEYRAEWSEGFFPGPGFTLTVPGARLFFAWYFVATSLHALHLAIGCVLCVMFAWLARSGLHRHAGAPRIHALALYWHFVDAVWIVLYPLIYLVAPRS